MSLIRDKELKEDKMNGLQDSIKEIKQHKSKVLRALKTLERWFAQGKINYETYQERKEKLSKLKGEYEVYLHRTKII